jgi:conjugative transfer signal peptidase TraF
VNRSESLPFLIYRITQLDKDERLKRGDSVLIDLSRFSNSVITQGVTRCYVNLREPMLKRIGAIPGDTVTLTDNALHVNRETVRQIIASRDSFGCELSAWPTPVTLSPDQYWLVSDPDRGFDSRYFGPVIREAITHRARPVF